MDHPVESWWVPWQLELVNDSTRTWHKVCFRPQDSLQSHRDGYRLMRKEPEGEPASDDETVVPDGWDHEHCALCWQKISTHEGDPSVGFTDGNDWLCIACHQKYLLPRGP